MKAKAPRKTLANTRLELIDCEPLRDVDRLTPGFYLAACPINGDHRAWPGAVVDRAPEMSGVFNERVAIVRRAATIGYVMQAHDDAIVLSLMNSATLLSVKPEAREATNVNLAVLGERVIQFTTAELLAPRTYRLSGIVTDATSDERGQRALDARVGQRFVLANDALVRCLLDAYMLNREYVYLATTISKPTSRGLKTRFTCRAQWWEREQSVL